MRDELVDYLPERLRLAGQGQEQMLVIDASTAEGDARVDHDLVAVREAHGVGADEEVDGVSAPAARDGVRAAGDRMRCVVAQLDRADLPSIEGLGGGAKGRALPLPRGRARRIARVLGIDARLQRAADVRETRTARQRHQVLPADVSSSALDAALVVSFIAAVASDVVRASSGGVGSAAGDPCVGSHLDARAPPQLVAAVSAKAAIAK